MKTEIIQSLTAQFEASAQKTDSGVEFWLARDIQHLLGYAEWRNFSAVLTKAKTACEVSGHPISDHFVEVTKMVDLGSGIKAKDFATEITIFNAQQHRMDSEAVISKEHITNNEAVRKTLLERGIHPESLPPAEDVKKVERRLQADDKKALKKPDALDS